jgi:hypothetical protein
LSQSHNPAPSPLLSAAPQETIGVLVASPLPWTLRIAKVDAYVGCNGESFVMSQLSASISGQRGHQSIRKAFNLPDERIHNILAVFSLDVDEHYKSGVALHQGSNVGVLAPREQIAFPVAWDRALLYFGRPLPDGYGVNNLSARLPLSRRCPTAPHDSPAAQTR